MDEPEFLTCLCNSCSGKIEFPAHGVGEAVECPHCGLMTKLYKMYEPPAIAQKIPPVLPHPPPLPETCQLVRCKLCHHEVARLAEFCPHCGQSLPGLLIECPRCKGTMIAAGKQGFGFGKAAAGALLLGPLGILVGGAGRNRPTLTCRSCGHSWH